MKRDWREADRRADAAGITASRTVGSSRARMDWFSLLRDVILRDSVIRVRHQLFDEPVLLVRESTFRRMEGE
jgi:hypothetical protein